MGSTENNWDITNMWISTHKIIIYKIFLILSIIINKEELTWLSPNDKSCIGAELSILKMHSHESKLQADNPIPVPQTWGGTK